MPSNQRILEKMMRVLFKDKAKFISGLIFPLLASVLLFSYPVEARRIRTIDSEQPAPWLSYMDEITQKIESIVSYNSGFVRVLESLYHKVTLCGGSLSQKDYIDDLKNEAVRSVRKIVAGLRIKIEELSLENINDQLRDIVASAHTEIIRTKEEIERGIRRFYDSLPTEDSYLLAGIRSSMPLKKILDIVDDSFRPAEYLLRDYKISSGK